MITVLDYTGLIYDKWENAYYGVDCFYEKIEGDIYKKLGYTGSSDGLPDICYYRIISKSNRGILIRSFINLACSLADHKTKLDFANIKADILIKHDFQNPYPMENCEDTLIITIYDTFIEFNAKFQDYKSLKERSYLIRKAIIDYILRRN